MSESIQKIEFIFKITYSMSNLVLYLDRPNRNRRDHLTDNHARRLNKKACHGATYKSHIGLKSTNCNLTIILST